MALKVHKYSVATKVKIINSSALILLIAAVSVVFGHIDGQKTFDANFTTFGALNNIDILLSFLVAITLLIKRYNIATVLIPCLILFSLMRLINNPNGTLSTIEVFVNVFSICFSIILIQIFSKLISLKQFAYSILLTFSFGTYVFTLNDFVAGSYSTMSIAELKRNVFYSWISGDTFVIINFFFVMLLAQTGIWLLSRVWTRSFLNEKETVFWTQISLEFWTEINKLKNHKNSLEVYFYENNKFEVKNTVNSFEVAIDEEEARIEIEKLLIQVSGPREIYLLPLPLIMVKASKNIRAPSI